MQACDALPLESETRLDLHQAVEAAIREEEAKQNAQASQEMP